MKNRVINEKAIQDIYKNAHTALQTINILLPKLKDEDIKAELKKQYDEYNKSINGISAYCKENKIEPKDINFFVKMMMNISVNMNAGFNVKKQHIADIMFRGTNMGVADLYALKNAMGSKLDDNVKSLTDTLLKNEERFADNLKAYL